jgi:hypothetical protein
MAGTGRDNAGGDALRGGTAGADRTGSAGDGPLFARVGAFGSTGARRDGNVGAGRLGGAGAGEAGFGGGTDLAGGGGGALPLPSRLGIEGGLANGKDFATRRWMRRSDPLLRYSD